MWIPLRLLGSMTTPCLAQALLVGLATVALAAEASHVLELHNSDTVTAAQLVAVLADLGVAEAQAMGLIQKVDQKGSAVIVAGSKESCEQAGERFSKIDMRTTVRPQQPSDTSAPSEFDGTAVIVLDEASFQSQVMSGEGSPVLVMFHAPWCSHCRQVRNSDARACG